MGAVVELLLNIPHVGVSHRDVPNQLRFFATPFMPYRPIFHCRRQAITTFAKYVWPHCLREVLEWSSLFVIIAIHLSGRFRASKPLENRNEVHHDEVCAFVTRVSSA
jgi:hypothetical protein